MKLIDFNLKQDNHFVSMEYYNLILNRTYLILYTPEFLVGIKVNGLVSIEDNSDFFTKHLTSSFAIKGDLSETQSYIKEKYLQKVQHYNLIDGSIKKANKSNFIIHAKEISDIYHDPRKKWGMGYYPHDGKVYIKYKNRFKREFIILGAQSGERIVNSLRNTFSL
jgi:hypothetical protein